LIFQVEIQKIIDLHQLCSSDFVSDNWVAYLYGKGNLVNLFSPTDFRYSATGQFQSLISLCKLSQETVNNSLSQLLTSDFINTDLLSWNTLDERIQTTINQFEMTMPMLMNALSTNWVINIPPNITNQWTAHTVPLVYQDCSCALSS
jgi:hypothetical protein